MPDDREFFSSTADAKAYLRELAWLWIAWLVGLGVLFFNNGWVVFIGGLIVVLVLIRLVKPLQHRVVQLIPENRVAEGGSKFSGKMTTRDRMLRDLVYGDGPIKAAIDVASVGRWWLLARHAVLALTALAFIAVIVSF